MLQRPRPRPNARVYLLRKRHCVVSRLRTSQLLFSVLHGFAMANLVTFNGNALRELAEQFLALAQAQSSTVPLMIGHRIMGHSRLFTGDVAESLFHYNRSIAIFDDANLPVDDGIWRC